MKRLSFSFLLTFGLLTTIFFACKEDDPAPLTPTISSISPTSGVVGDTVTIAGNNFSSTPAQNTVQFGTANATVISATAAQLQVTVPQLAAGSYDVKVTIEGETTTASTQFTVTEEGTAEPGAELVQHLQDNNNVVADPGLAGISRTNDGGLNPIPAAAEVTANLAAYPDAAFFTQVNYKGAFDPSAAGTWLDGWSILSRAGYLAGGGTDGAAYDPSTATIVDVPQSITEDTEWTSDNVYRINGLTYVESGTLTIQPGTVIIAEATPTTGDNTSALIITRGAMINAEGTADAPIILTSEFDEGSLIETDVAQWGGLIILGEATVIDGGSSEAQVEGISTDEPRARYGGNNDDDNSGVIKYVSIRYTGAELSAGNELQGLTLGAVGRGTTIEYIESFASSDDGMEIFGGTANVKYFAAAFAEDDSYDYDTGWRGYGQFWFSIQRPDAGDHAGEWDGAIPDNASLYSNPTIYNATFIGRGQGATRGADAPAIIMRDNTAGTLANSIITDFDGKGIEIEDLPGSGDSYNRFLDGEIQLLNNIWYVNPSYTELNTTETGIIRITVTE